MSSAHHISPGSLSSLTFPPTLFLVKPKNHRAVFLHIPPKPHLENHTSTTSFASSKPRPQTRRWSPDDKIRAPFRSCTTTGYRSRKSPAGRYLARFPHSSIAVDSPLRSRAPHARTLACDTTLTSTSDETWALKHPSNHFICRVRLAPLHTWLLLIRSLLTGWSHLFPFCLVRHHPVGSCLPTQQSNPAPSFPDTISISRPLPPSKHRHPRLS